VSYVDPWLSNFDQRMRQLTAQPRRIAYFYERPDISTFRYRAFNPGLTLAAKPDLGVSAAWFDHRDLNADDSFIDAAHALVICRARYNARVANMAARARARGIPVLFDCDDLVFDVTRAHLLVDSLGVDQSKRSSLGLLVCLYGQNRRDVAPLRLFRHDQRVSSRPRPGV
jgi:hypothetical protein